MWRKNSERKIIWRRQRPNLRPLKYAPMFYQLRYGGGPLFGVYMCILNLEVLVSIASGHYGVSVKQFFCSLAPRRTWSYYELVPQLFLSCKAGNQAMLLEAHAPLEKYKKIGRQKILMFVTCRDVVWCCFRFVCREALLGSYCDNKLL